MADRVELAFGRAARETIPDGSNVLVAVSGGGDSVALLHLLHGLAERRRLHLTVAHLDHALRRGSSRDRRFVERLAAELELPFVGDRRDVAGLRRADESPEEAARRVRRDFLLRAARQHRSDRIATGHTLDDQAETVLMRWVRGAGPTALTGMIEGGPLPWVKPLLGLERDELRRYLERHARVYLSDPTNRMMRFDRNRVRVRLLPMLADALNPRVARQLVRSADRVREDARYLDQVARTVFAQLSRRGPDNELWLSRGSFMALPAPIARRVARLALRQAGADERRVSIRHIEALRMLARGGGRQLHLPSGVIAERCRETLCISKRISD